MPYYTVVGQLRNFHGDTDLLFGDFTIQDANSIGWERVCDLFGQRNVLRDDWFYVRTYQVGERIPAQRRAHMIADFEEAIFLLRLFRVGELGVVSIGIETDDGGGSTRLMWNRSMSPDYGSYPEYEIDEDEIPAWRNLAAQVVNGQGFRAVWFNTARRFFTYGAATPLEIHWGDVDRYVDYCVALEALIVPEDDRVGIRLRRRASKLLNHEGDVAKATEKLLKEFYNVRSAVVHGRELSEDQKSMLRDDHPKFEQLVRDLAVTSVSLPSSDANHVSALVALYDLSSEEKVDLVVESFRALSQDERRDALQRLGLRPVASG